jgi:DNA-binding transcriptional MerR regulator
MDNLDRQVPLCRECNINEVSFSRQRGFTTFCSVKCSLKYNNRNNNAVKNKKRSEKVNQERLEVLETAAQYYVDNTIKISDVSRMFSLPYSALRTYLSKNNLIKKSNQHIFKTKKFMDTVDERLVDEQFLKQCRDSGLSLKDVAKMLNVAPNTVRLYALEKNVRFDSETEAEREVLEFLKQYDPDTQKTRKVIKPYEIDVYSSKYNLGIEIHGEFWHNEDRAPIQYHLSKQKMAENNNIKLMQIYLYEWVAKKTILQSMILSNLGISHKVHARKLKFTKLDKKEAKSFFENNHLQGWLKCSHVFGLVDNNNEIMSAISFGKSRFDKSCDFELLRFCNKLGHNIVGGFSRLMVNAEKELNFSSIITYSHRRMFSGRVYEVYGFEKIKATRPGYFWYNIKNKNIIQRYSTQKHKLKTHLSEIEYMKMLDYRRVFDCGQFVYKYNKQKKKVLSNGNESLFQ